MQPLKARLFIAIPVPARFQGVISAWSKTLKQRWIFKSWVHPADYHITVKFLGECDFPTASRVKERLKGIAQKQSPFRLAIDGLGTFGLREKPRILWAGVKGDLDRLHRLQKEVEDHMEEIGFPREKRSYHPHMTIARTYTGDQFQPADLDKAPVFGDRLLQWDVPELVLYRTHLDRKPMYQPLARFPFGGSD